MGQYYRIITRNAKGTTVYDRSVDGEYTMAKLMEHSWFRNRFCCALAEKLVDNPTKVCWVGDYAEPKECEDLGFTYEAVWGTDAYDPAVTIHGTTFQLSSKRFLINKTKNKAVDLKEYAKKNSDDEGWIINPIPLLTCLGNGRGGGDFHAVENSGTTESYIGAWAMDKIYISDTLPERCKMIHPIFRERPYKIIG